MKKNKQKGITLIALVITIIVIVILTGVTIATITGKNGIIKQTNNAKAQIDDEKFLENIELAYTRAKNDSNNGERDISKSIKKYLEKALDAKEIKVVQCSDKNGFFIIIDNALFLINEDEKIQTGDFAREKAANDGILYYDEKIITIGDYVAYDPTSGANNSDLVFTSTSSMTGYESDQNFDARTYKNNGYGWQFLGIDNGKILLISEETIGSENYSDNSKTKYYLNGFEGYINGVSELNNICSIFGYGKGAESARSIVFDDYRRVIDEKYINNNSEAGKYTVTLDFIGTTTKNVSYYGEKFVYQYTYEDSKGSRANWETWENPFEYPDFETKSFKELDHRIELEHDYSTLDYNSWMWDVKSTEYMKNDELGELSENVTVEENVDYCKLPERAKMLFGYEAALGSNRRFVGKGEKDSWIAEKYCACRKGAVYEYGSPSPSNARIGLKSSGQSNYKILVATYGPDNGGTNTYETSDYVRPIVTLKAGTKLEWDSRGKQWKIN